ncbi:unnamed protein product [Owenia fusiformis]|uniref:Uncharacterized protein n=1 Tax=Owenia fusiformis TaxID=6347 RepID=A0A8J1TG86_OWEFU|nr:unnamed protein product [Owenia fusiformis]
MKKLSNTSDEQRIEINRSIYKQDIFNETFKTDTNKEKSSCIQSMCSKVDCSSTKWKEHLATLFPFAHTIKHYEWRRQLLGDVVAGLSVGVLHVPQGMGFGLLAGLSPVYGLYSSFFPVLAYFFFTSSRHASFGTMALTALMVGVVVNRHMGPSPMEAPLDDVTGEVGTTMDPYLQHEMMGGRIMMATSLTLLAGLIQIVMSLLRLGFLTVYMSQPFMSGFMTGAAVHIITSQMKFLTGMSESVKTKNGYFKIFKTYQDIAARPELINYADVIVSAVAIVTLVILRTVAVKCQKRFNIPLPCELLIIIFATMGSYFVGLSTRFHTRTVGMLPIGLPMPVVPDFNHVQSYFTDAIIIAIVGFVVSISMTKIISEKYNYEVNSNQELFAYGFANTIGSFFHCFAGAVAPPRTLIRDACGGKTQLSSLVSCMVVLVVILGIGPLFKDLPNSALSSIIVVAVSPLLMKCKDLLKYWKINRFDASTWLITSLSIVILDIDVGLIIGIGYSLLSVIIRTQLASSYTVTNIEKTELYVKNPRMDDAIKIFKYDGPVYYGNAEMFKARLYSKTYDPSSEADDRINSKREHLKENITQEIPVSSISNGLSQNIHITNHDKNKNATHAITDPHKVVIIDFSCVSFIDVVAINTLIDTHKTFRLSGVQMFIAGCTDSVYDSLKTIENTEKEKPENDLLNNIFVTVHDAVKYVHSMNQWTDITPPNQSYSVNLTNETSKL